MPFDASQLVSGLQAASKAKLAAALRGVDIFGEQVIGDAQNLCPVDNRPHAPHPGNLQASGTTEPAEVDGTKITKKIGFNAFYAAAVHEILTSRHDIGQAKFLEAALNEDGAKFGPFIAGHVAAAGGEA